MRAPFSSKRSVSSRIIKHVTLKPLSSLDLLWADMNKGTEILHANTFTDQGKLIPDDIMTRLALHELKNLAHCSWLLDGFPRMVPQGEALDKINQIDTVVDWNVPFEIIEQCVSSSWIHPCSGQVYNTEFNPPRKIGIDINGEPIIQGDKPEAVTKRLKVRRPKQNLFQSITKMKVCWKFYLEQKPTLSGPQVYAFLQTKLSDITQKEAMTS